MLDPAKLRGCIRKMQDRTTKELNAIEGIIDKGKEIMKEFKGSPALDAGLLAAAQSVEHYEISRYGTLKTWAQALGMGEAAELLDETLTEEKNTDAALTELAETAVNAEAQQPAEQPRDELLPGNLSRARRATRR